MTNNATLLLKGYDHRKMLLDIKYGGEHMERLEYLDEFIQIVKPLNCEIPWSEIYARELQNWVSGSDDKF